MWTPHPRGLRLQLLRGDPAEGPPLPPTQWVAGVQSRAKRPEGPSRVLPLGGRPCSQPPSEARVATSPVHPGPGPTTASPRARSGACFPTSRCARGPLVLVGRVRVERRGGGLVCLMLSISGLRRELRGPVTSSRPGAAATRMPPGPVRRTWAGPCLPRREVAFCHRCLCSQHVPRAAGRSTGPAFRRSGRETAGRSRARTRPRRSRQLQAVTRAHGRGDRRRG